jgi:hypothetical protein
LNPFSNLLEIGGAKAAAHHGPLRVCERSWLVSPAATVADRPTPDGGRPELIAY